MRLFLRVRVRVIVRVGARVRRYWVNSALRSPPIVDVDDTALGGTRVTIVDVNVDVNVNVNVDVRAVPMQASAGRWVKKPLG